MFIRVTPFFCSDFVICVPIYIALFCAVLYIFIQIHIYFNVPLFQFLFVSGEKKIQQSLKMKGLYLVEPVVAFYAFSSFLMYPLIQQYVYRRLWQELTNSSFPATDNNSRCAETSSNQSSQHEVSCFIGHNCKYLKSHWCIFPQRQAMCTAQARHNYLYLCSAFTCMTQHFVCFCCNIVQTERTESAF